MKFKEFHESREQEFKQFSEIEIMNFENSALFESGDSASEVQWVRKADTLVGSFTVQIGENYGDFYIVIKPYTRLKCKELSIMEFKFHENFDIKKSNLMTFHLGVGPTIKKEFKKYIKEKGPECIIFSADRVEKTREKAYDKNTALIAKELGYIPFYKTATTSEYHEYALVREDKVEEFQKCFKTTNI